MTSSERAVPRATYRVQLHAGVTFADAAAIVDYLRDLGVSHLYVSPVLQAMPGSTHGYAAVDHSRVSDELGGEERFLRHADYGYSLDGGDPLPDLRCPWRPAGVHGLSRTIDAMLAPEGVVTLDAR